VSHVPDYTDDRTPWTLGRAESNALSNWVIVGEKALRKNLERLKAERLAREVAKSKDG